MQFDKIEDNNNIDSSENVLTIKEMKKDVKKKKNIKLTEEEKKRRSENFKKNALPARKNNLDEKKLVEDYKNTLNALLNNSSEIDENNDEYEEDEENYKYNKKNKQKNNYSNDSKDINLNFMLEVMKQQKNEFDDKIKNLTQLQEKSNNRLERLYQIKKTKIKAMGNEPLKIINEKDKKMPDTLQNAILNKILNQ